MQVRLVERDKKFEMKHYFVTFRQDVQALDQMGSEIDGFLYYKWGIEEPVSLLLPAESFSGVHAGDRLWFLFYWGKATGILSETFKGLLNGQAIVGYADVTQVEQENRKQVEVYFEGNRIYELPVAVGIASPLEIGAGPAQFWEGLFPASGEEVLRILAPLLPGQPAVYGARPRLLQKEN